MKLTIEITLDNAAFEEGGTEEVQRILTSLCERLPEPLQETRALNLYDLNGNYVGNAVIA